MKLRKKSIKKTMQKKTIKIIMTKFDIKTK